MKFPIVRFVFWVASTGLVVFVLTIAFGDALAAKLATQRWVQKYNLVKPRAPLVINTREEVRVSDTNDTIGTIGKNQEKIAAVVVNQNGVDVLRGAAIAAISDGVWLSVKAVVSSAPNNELYLVTNSGVRERVTAVVADPASNVVLLQTGQRGLPVPTFRPAKSAVVGERVILLGAQNNGAVYFVSSFISAAEQIASGTISADVPARSLALQPVSGLMPGQVGFDFSGQVTGVYDGQVFIPASVLQEVLSSFVSNEGVVVRPVYGFGYAYQRGSGKTTGLLVMRRAEGSPAGRAGLQEGDLIVKVGSQDVASVPVPDALLTSAPAGGKVTLTVQRAGKSMEIVIEVGTAQ
ncbi:MAG: PDZ domain-containing protein [Candidatus Doudnabacteria bacterium]|nr:PDZ domain-containing protein [Candidatus Doudnabacteria bacterium]